ncbi:MAG TPA: hypothetical protein VFO55_12715 [Gemmatimonadaceae bacterium]|nr:hypothetical protein [Gemmatimonadaceae bacterium]
MITAAAFALLVAQASPPRQTIVRDSTRPDSTASRRRPQPIRRPVTAALRESAFRDPAARGLVEKARSARIAQDSTILAYDAGVAQRLSVRAAIGSVALERLAYRQEATARVRWQRGIGAHIDVTGGRVSIPLLGMPKEERKALENVAADPTLIPIPYFPGQEPLWVGQFAARPDVNERSMVNPLANGAEAYYTFSSSERTTIRLASGDSLVVRRVDVRPRRAEPNLIIGSLWLDDASGQVVRAAYRMAAPGRGAVTVDTRDSSGRKSVRGRIVENVFQAMMPTMTADITDIVVEYQRVRSFWLPRSQVMEGFVKSTFARVPVTIENRFRFESVNEASSLAPISVDTMSTRTRTVDSVEVRSLDQCRTSDTRVVTAWKADSVAITMRVPCDLDRLMASPELPASAFADNEETFGTAQRDELVAQALSMLDQAPLAWPGWRMPQLEYGVSHTRYNRIEGLSTGVLATQQLGSGMDVRAIGRIGTADRTPRFELSLGRSNASKTIRLGGYESRLVSMSDRESPLSFGSSLSAFFFGRDDAFYYRTTGGELLWNSDRGIRLDWRAYHERQRTATQRTDFSLGGSFLPNIGAAEGTYTGAEVRYRGSRGLDPRGFRASTEVRLDAATGDSTFGRGSLELTFLRGFGAALDGALTVAGGTSVGGVPVQRLWYLGGTQTIRGIGVSSAYSGNAFWMTRVELARPVAFLRLAAFGDMGWAGDRGAWREVGRPLSGAGLGFSFFDGTVRLDVARGIHPVQQTRVSFYLGSRF